MRIKFTLLAAAIISLAGAALAAPPPQPQRPFADRYPNVFMTPQVSSPPIQFQNQGTPLGVSFTFNCSTGMSCSFVNGVMTVTSTGGSGTINSCGTSNALAYYSAATTLSCDGAVTTNTSGVISAAGEAITPASDTATVFTVKNNTGTTTVLAVDTRSGGNGLVVTAPSGGGFAGVFGGGAVTFAGVRNAGNYSLGSSGQGTLFISPTSPSIAAAGCGGSAATISTKNGTAAFKVGVGTSNTGTCTVTMPAATTDWICSATDITTTSTTVSQTKSKPGGTPTTQITLQNYTDVSGTAAWVDNDVLAVSCWGE